MQRCKAKSKRSQEQCKNYAIKGWGVCRMHGAKGGPKTEEGVFACTSAPYKHGLYSSEVQQELKECRGLMKKDNNLQPPNSRLQIKPDL